ncbi:hypothetical protein ACE7GA_01190 [Roseomonas sp. CCTCC AB2023176]|uniref:hypothetical protein n=1 Tax=Roseomonas sp. CCTCC AB2023176 TaxID=3342640 RepID=UPI0035DC6123
MTIRGSVDSLTPEGASGWAFAGGGRPLVVQALLDGRVIGETVAESERPDLSAAGLGDGQCGFAMAFYDAPIDPAMLPFVSIRPRGGDVELPRTNLTGYGEFFRTLHARYPGAGRQRSVFGGLWTDRTDARRLLAGRVATGATPADLVHPLRGFIGEGYAILRDVLPPSLDARTADLPAGALDPSFGPAAAKFLETLPARLFREPVLRLVRAILDDHPTVYRVAVTRAGDPRPGFAQASAAEALPSPAECLLLVSSLSSDPAGFIGLDVVRGSHELPEFTSHGRSRWLAEDLPDREPAGLELAREFGASVEMLEVGPRDVALLGPGTLHRLRTPGPDRAALRTWCVPARISPSRAISEAASALIMRHESGAVLAV